MNNRRILVLSRPVVNAGDFLFSEKSIDAFRHIIPNIDVIGGNTTQEYDLEYLNSFDSIVAAGGPLYDDRFLNGTDFPVMGMLKKISSPFSILSAGWYGRDATKKSIYDYRFAKSSLNILKFIDERGGVLTCRDDITANILRNNGLKNVVMVGCAAWYDFDRINVLMPRYKRKIEKIIISDQGITKDSNTWKWKYKAFEDTLDTVLGIFPSADISFTFNGGIETKYSAEYNNMIRKLLEKTEIEYFDISGNSDGFGLYDDIDLHIGFRMHSHIYCMSKRIPSILIGEDARGSGCNRSMGLPDIVDYSIEAGKIRNNYELKKDLEYYIDDLIRSEFTLLSSSYNKMKTVYETAFEPMVRKIAEL